MKSVTSGGGWKAVRYTLHTANRVGWRALWRAIVPRDVDPRSKTPAFKSVLIEVLPETRVAPRMMLPMAALER